MANIERQDYLNTLHTIVRTIQRYMKNHEAPVRCYDGKPRHVREATRHYDGNKIREMIALNAGMKDCAWGNCRMCGLSTKGEELTEKEVESQLNLFENLPLLKEVSSLYLSPYSFFSDSEMSSTARKKVYDIINSHPNIKYAVFMTRLNYITDKKLKELRAHLKKQKVIIWIGAETSDKFTANYCIDKGYSWEDVEKASELMRKYGIKTGIWVLLKPPFVSEKEGIKDAVKTIRKGFDNDYEIRLMPTEVMEFTVVEQLFDMGKYRPPWLWSIISVLKKFSTEEHKRIDISGPHFERKWSIVPRELHSSKILKFPSNCAKCNEKVFRAILQYNETKDINTFNGIGCKCKSTWESELNRKTPLLKKRMIGEFSDIIVDFIEKRR